MSNLVEGDNKEHLNNSEFCELIPHLKLNDLLLIEYRTSDKWSRLFKVNNPATKVYLCDLCGVSQSGLKNLVAHIDGKKHKLQMKSVKQLFHHEYTYLKTEGNLAAGGSFEESETTLDSNDSTSRINISSKTTVYLLDFTITNENYESKFTDTIANIQKSNSIERNMNEKQEDSDREIVVTKVIAAKQPTQKASMQKIFMKNKDNPSLTCSRPKDRPVQNEAKQLDSILEQSSNKNHRIDQLQPIIDNNLSKKKRSEFVISNKNTDAFSKRPTILVNPPILQKKESNISEVPQTETHGRLSHATNIVVAPSKYKKITSDVTLNNQPRFTTKSFGSEIHSENLQALLGAEYVIKIMKYKDDKSPKYECSLCELILEGRSMQNHLIGYNHRLKYCEKHFPTAVNQFRLSIDKVPVHEEFKVLGPILSKLATAVEEHHGRELPFESMERDFNQNRHRIFLEVFSRRHASEQNGPSFTNVVDAKEIDQLVLNRHTYKPPLVYDTPSNNTNFPVKLSWQNSAPIGLRTEINSNLNQASTGSFAQINSRFYTEDMPYVQMAPQPVYQNVPTYSHVDNFPPVPEFGAYANTQVDDDTHRLMVENFLRTNKKHSYRPSTESKHCNLKRTNVGAYVNSRSPDRKRQRSHSPLDKSCENKLAENEKLFRGYRENPETHPKYKKEWQQFWNRRKNELIAAGLDHRTHNYQPEWVNFLKVRIEELYVEAVENIKRQFEGKPTSIWESSNRNICGPFNSTKNNEVFDSAGVENSLESTAEVSSTSNTSVVSVLRFLTALEEHLGSLGPKIIELLSKALQAEKICPENINSVMLTIENCTLLETAKEKFKGLVIAEFLDPTKERVLKKAIKEVELLLQIAEKEGNANNKIISGGIVRTGLNKSEVRHPIVKPLSDLPSKEQLAQNPQIPNISTSRTTQKQLNVQNPAISKFLAQTDKKQLALKLAAAISAQGKTDCDPDQLQQLLAVYALMERKKREAAQAPNLTVMGTKLFKKAPIQKTLSDTLTDYLHPSTGIEQSEHHNYGVYGNDSERLVIPGNSNQDLVAQRNEATMWENLQNIFKNSQIGSSKDQNLQDNNKNFQNVHLTNRNTYNTNGPMNTLIDKESYAVSPRIETNFKNFNQTIKNKYSSSPNKNFLANASMNTFRISEIYSYNASNNSRIIGTNIPRQMNPQCTDSNVRGAYYLGQQQQYRQPTYHQPSHFETQQQQEGLRQNRLWNTDNPARNSTFAGTQIRNNNNGNNIDSNLNSFRAGNIGNRY